MSRSPLLASVTAALWQALAAAHAAVPLPPAEAAQAFQLADPALVVELVAAEPLTESPCALAFDEAGRLYVAENRGYPNTSEPAQGRIALLKDTTGDGQMDERVTFAEGLTFPNGVLPWRGGLIVTCAPDVLFLKDTDGDGRADERRVLLTGFAISGSTQLRVNAPTLGPDGWIYLAAGLSGGSITAPAYPERPSLKMTADIRFHPDTLEIEQVDGRSQYGMSFDDFGRRFICMNRLPVQHVVLDSRWLRRNPHLAFSDTVQDCHERDVKTALRGGGAGVRLHPISSNVTTADSHAGSFSAACGVFVWPGGELGAAYDRSVFSCDPTGNLVHADQLATAGATFAAQPSFEKKEFLASTDDWFRPVYLATGPDGALYIADMCRLVIEHPDYLPQEIRKRTDFESGKFMGRIWRVKRKAAAASGVAVEGSPINMIARAHGWRRQIAFRALTETPANPEELRAAMLDASPSGQAHLLALLAQQSALDSAALQAAANSSDPRVREVGLRLWLHHPAARAWLPDPAVLGNEPDARARFMAALALGEIPEGTAALAAIAAKDSADRWTRAAVLSSIHGRVGEFIDAFLQAEWQLEPGAIELLRAAGRNFPSVRDLRAFLDANDIAAAGRESRSEALAALLLGASERSGNRVDASAANGWLGKLLERCVNEAENTERSIEERELCIQILGRMQWSKAGATLLKLATQENSDRLRTAAIRASASFAEPSVAQTLLAGGAWTRATPAQREVLLDALISRPAHAAGVLDAAEDGRLPPNAIPANRRAALLKLSDKSLKARAEALFGRLGGDRQAAFESSKAALALEPNPERGRELFQQLCATCHRLDRAGHAVGPDLFDIRNQTKENILFHIVVPDAEIAPAFAAYIAETTDGRSLTGVLASETPASITLRGPLAQENSLVRSEIKSLEALPTSLMPAGLEQAMTPQGIADLLAYLKGQ